MRPRGRPPSFDRSEVISGAVRAFWANGFEDTTLAQLEKSTGVDRSTLYNSFDGKAGLYRHAASAYVDLVDEWLFGPLQTGERGIADILELFDRLGAGMRSPASPPGCLIVNDMASSPDQAATDRYLASLQAALLRALDRAAEAGEVDPTRSPERVQILVAAFIGVSLVSRRSADMAAPQTMIDGVREVVSSWATRRPLFGWKQPLA